EVGYQHGKTVFDVWCRSGVVEKMLKDRHQEEFHNTHKNNMVTCPNASFTDLAEIVSRIELVKQTLIDEESDYHTDYEEELVGSALSDMEHTNYCSEHTEEELTADTDEDLDRVHSDLNSEDSSRAGSSQPQHTTNTHSSPTVRARKVQEE
ncbi:patatin-like phospholipase domain-containing protein 7a, partial [Tachysurus ichikawai]